MRLISVLFAFLLGSFKAYAVSDLLDNFYVHGVNVNRIYTTHSHQLNSDVRYIVAYAYNANTSSKDDRVGVFVESGEKGVTILDIFRPGREKDFIPFIEAFSTTELVVSFNSENGEVKRIKYTLQPGEQVRLVSRTEMEMVIPEPGKHNNEQDEVFYEKVIKLKFPAYIIASKTDFHPMVQEYLDRNKMYLAGHFNFDNRLDFVAVLLSNPDMRSLNRADKNQAENYHTAVVICYQDEKTSYHCEKDGYIGGGHPYRNYIVKIKPDEPTDCVGDDGKRFALAPVIDTVGYVHTEVGVSFNSKYQDGTSIRCITGD